MGWFKVSKNFDDRNLIIKKIEYLQEIRKTVDYLGRIIFQSGTTAKNRNYDIITSDKITSYPSLHRILSEADSMALDNPWKFAETCNMACNKIDDLIYSLKKERDEITFGKKNIEKGWID